MTEIKDTDESNIDFKERLIKLENENDKEDSMRKMVWFALFGMLLYPSLVLICDFNGLEKSLNVLSELAETYFVSVSGIVAVYFGANAYSKKN